MQKYDVLSKKYEEIFMFETENLVIHIRDRGVSKQELGQHEEAIKDFDEAIRLDPKDSFAFRNRGYSKQSLGQHEEAIKDYNEAIRLDAKDSFAFINRGYSKNKLGYYEEAIKDYDEAIRLNPRVRLDHDVCHAAIGNPY
jgi:tetratricopeptide (TPR) repeat protein